MWVLLNRLPREMFVKLWEDINWVHLTDKCYINTCLTFSHYRGTGENWANANKITDLVKEMAIYCRQSVTNGATSTKQCKVDHSKANINQMLHISAVFKETESQFSKENCGRGKIFIMYTQKSANFKKSYEADIVSSMHLASTKEPQTTFHNEYMWVGAVQCCLYPHTQQTDASANITINCIHLSERCPSQRCV
jgi:hypothetical protein